MSRSGLFALALGFLGCFPAPSTRHSFVEGDSESGARPRTLDVAPVRPLETAPARPLALEQGHGSSQPPGYVALLREDFNRYPSTEAFIAETSASKRFIAVSPHLLTLDDTVMYKGHRTLRYSQPGGNGLSPQLEIPLPRPLSQAWIRAKIRWSPGFTTTGTLTNSANAYKVIGWGWTGFDGRGTLEVSNTNEYQLNWGVRSTTGEEVGPYAWASAGHVRREWADGAWYDYIIHFKVIDRFRTLTQVWIARDGNPPVLRASVNGSIATISVSAPLLSRVSFGQNFNQQRRERQSQAIWYGEWEIVDGATYPDPFNVLRRRR